MREDKTMHEKIKNIITKIKRDNPLVLNITNVVTMDFVANGLLSLGASPVMSKARQEIEDLMTLAKSVVINLGTLDEAFITLCEHACLIANQLQKPIVVDPVGAGASRYRTDACLRLINDYHISIIRGNAGEIRALSGLAFATKGVDSAIQSEDAIAGAQALSTRINATIVISGETDVIVDADKISRFYHGSSLMPTVTGTGCLLSAVVSAFHAVEQNRVEVATAATIFYGVCGEIAAENARGPGTFKTAFLDALHTIPDRSCYEKK